MRHVILLALAVACDKPEDEDTTHTRTDEPDADTDSDTDEDSDPGTNTDTDSDLPGVAVTTDNGDGTATTVVDATSETEWVYFHFADGTVTPADPLTDSGWDLAFNRFNVVANGGVSGGAGTTVAVLPGVALDALTSAPAGGYLADAADGDGDGYLDAPLSAWYTYDPTTHQLSPADASFAVLTGDGRRYALRFDGYYDDTGASGWPAFTWKVLSEPALVATADGDALVLEVDASVDGDPRTLMAPLALEVDAGWDLALERSEIRLGSTVEAAWVDGAFASVVDVPASGFTADADTDGDGIADVLAVAWYDYDPVTHQLTPKAGTWVVRHANGAYKLAIDSYYAADGTSGHYTLRVAPLATP